MSGPTKTQATEAEEERALRENLQVRVLTPEALARIRRATEAEWRAHVGSTPRKVWLSYAAAASVGALAVAAAWAFMSHGWDAHPGEVMARVTRAEAPGVLERRSLWRDQDVSVGSDLVSGRTFQARGATLLSLSGGGNLRIAHGSQFEVISANKVRLDSGEMYVDIPKGAHPGASFVAITNAGEFRHLGTQFALSVANGETRLRVREGSVMWHAEDGDATVEAGSEVVIDRLRHVMRRLIETSGSQWAWTEAMAPAIDIENRPVSEFLDWYSRETGRELVVADAATQRQVTTIHMHGDVHGLEPAQALAAVLGSTSLRFQVSPGAIRVSSEGGSPTPSQ
jgi:ferric-dicitrate binding protein FerR (iron transport regulator)